VAGGVEVAPVRAVVCDRTRLGGVPRSGHRTCLGVAVDVDYLAGWAIESMAIVTASIRTGSWSGLISIP
jgi:hypothetical protein